MRDAVQVWGCESSISVFIFTRSRRYEWAKEWISFIHFHPIWSPVCCSHLNHPPASSLPYHVTPTSPKIIHITFLRRKSPAYGHQSMKQYRGRHEWYSIKAPMMVLEDINRVRSWFLPKRDVSEWGSRFESEVQQLIFVFVFALLGRGGVNKG